jgi:hypothetical protein
VRSVRGLYGDQPLLGFLHADPPADHFFEPAMQPDGAWAATFDWLVVIGSGAGMALMFVACVSR